VCLDKRGGIHNQRLSWFKSREIYAIGQRIKQFVNALSGKFKNKQINRFDKSSPFSAVELLPDTTPRFLFVNFSKSTAISMKRESISIKRESISVKRQSISIKC